MVAGTDARDFARELRLENPMAFYRERVYPHIVDAVGNPKPIDDIRRRIIPIAHGDVLEIGVGPGVNFPHYDPGKVGKVFALEPNRGMLQRAEKRRRDSQLDVEFLDLPGERIPLGDSSVDTVVSTFTMCTIPAGYLSCASAKASARERGWSAERAPEVCAGAAQAARQNEGTANPRINVVCRRTGWSPVGEDHNIEVRL